MLDDNSTDSWGPIVNVTETEEGLWTVNASSEWRGENETALWDGDEDLESERTTRIVGGDLERRGGSPWQVWTHFTLTFINFI